MLFPVLAAFVVVSFLSICPKKWFIILKDMLSALVARAPKAVHVISTVWTCEKEAGPTCPRPPAKSLVTSLVVYHTGVPSARRLVFAESLLVNGIAEVHVVSVSCLSPAFSAVPRPPGEAECLTQQNQTTTTWSPSEPAHRGKPASEIICEPAVLPQEGIRAL